MADVLSALGAVPTGFRESTLAKLLNDIGSEYNCNLLCMCVDAVLCFIESHRTSQWLFPKPSSTGMAFRDLIWNHDTEQVDSSSSALMLQSAYCFVIASS